MATPILGRGDEHKGRKKLHTSGSQSGVPGPATANLLEMQVLAGPTLDLLPMKLGAGRGATTFIFNKPQVILIDLQV